MEIAKKYKIGERGSRFIIYILINICIVCLTKLMRSLGLFFIEKIPKQVNTLNELSLQYMKLNRCVRLINLVFHSKEFIYKSEQGCSFSSSSLVKFITT